MASDVVAKVQSAFTRTKGFFSRGETRSPEFRREQLARLKAGIRKREREVLEALHQDVGKPDSEAFVGEVSFLYEEIDFAQKHLRRWMKPRRVPTPLLLFRAKSRIVPEPLGVVLIIGPWNYPFQLALAPLVGAIAAGNGAIIKPSELAPATSKIIATIVAETFSPDFVTCLEGGIEVSQHLLNLPFDHIFFTGGGLVGRAVMAAAAQHLTPVTLELGGKSPCIVASPTNLEPTARRIAWGKFYNAGQTCVAPDYLLVQKELKAPLVDKIKESIDSFFGGNPRTSKDYGRIINDRHFLRLKGLAEQGKVLVGGDFVLEERYISPTLLENVSPEDGVMTDEIFGPILPVITYDSLEEAIAWVNARPKPLALYLFTDDRDKQKQVIDRISFGGGCVNDTLVHLTNPHLPFGGVGPSGMGRYHGKFGFDTFSHFKSVVVRSLKPDLKQRYPPYPGVEFYRKMIKLLG